MISVITTSYNSKFDLDQLVRYLHQWNEPKSFEVVVAHDNRVTDGSEAALALLEEEFSNVSHVETKEPLIENGKEVTNTVLLNGLAVGKSVGATLLFFPVSWLPGFKMVDLESFATGHSVDGQFYSRLDSVRLDISNQGSTEIERAVAHRKQQQARSRWMGSPVAIYPGLAREYDLRCADLSSYLLVDPRDGSSISLDNAEIMPRVRSISDAMLTGKNPRCSSKHLTDVINRKTWDTAQGKIGDCEPYFVESPSSLTMLALRRHESLRASPRACLGVDAQALQHAIPKRRVRLCSTR